MSTFSNENHVTRGFTSDAINEFAFRLSVLHGIDVYKASIFFYSSVYVQPCLSKNPKYTLYTIKSSLTLAYYVAFWSCDTVRKLMRQATQKVNIHLHGRKG
jgi:hypothetical protein